MGPFFLSEDMKSAINRAVIFIIACAFMYIGLTFTYSDIATSGRFYDNLGLQQVLSDPVAVQNMAISTEGWLFGVALFLLQIYSEYKAASEKGRNRRIWLGVRIVTGIFDTYTDSDFRSFSFSSAYLAFKSLLVSVFVYNVFSEMALGISLREFMKHWSSFIYVIKEIAVEIKSLSAKPKDEKKDHSPAPQPRHEPVFHPEPHPFGGGENKYQKASELGERLKAGKIGDTEFIALLRQFDAGLRAAVLRKLPGEIQKRIAGKMGAGA